MKTKTFFTFAFICFSFFSIAQKSSLKWGKVAKADLSMKEFSADPDTEALVLGDIGRVSIDVSSGEIIYHLDHHKRIKIFKQSGFDRGNIQIPYYSPNNYEVIKGLKAQVILPNGDKIAVKKIYDEKINSYWSVKKFAIPNLTEGCIIEYKYSKDSKGYFNLEEWYFQGDIPVRLSQLTTEMPEWYQYISFTQGRKAAVEESERFAQITIPGRGTHEKAVTGSRGSRISHDAYDRIDTRLVHTVYKMTDVPALKVEPHITTMDDYYAKIQFQLQTVDYPNTAPQNVQNTWREVEEDLIQYQHFGDQFLKKRYTKKMWDALEPQLASAQNQEEQMSLILKFVTNNLVWDETYQFMVEKTLDDAYESKSASSGEINLALIALCKQAGIQAHPILISTRSHGKMLPLYPKTDQFNHVLVYVFVNNKEYLIDAGGTYRPPNLLRKNSFNYKGWLIQPNLSEWIDIPVQIDKEVCLAKFEISSEGKLIGEIEQSFDGYCAVDERKRCANDQDFKKLKDAWTEKYVDMQFDSIQIENQYEINKPFKTNIHCSIPGAITSTGDFMYISPIIDAFLENPFKLENRDYAVDMVHGFKNQYILNLTIPEGYVVEELPEAENLSLPNKGGKFQFFISQNGNTIQLVNKINISQIHFEPEEYQIIKNFYDIIAEKHSEQIVLKKAT